MSIPHRILTPDDPSKPFSKALTESDSSEDYVTAQSSMADVSHIYYLLLFFFHLIDRLLILRF